MQKIPSAKKIISTAVTSAFSRSISLALEEPALTVGVRIVAEHEGAIEVQENRPSRHVSHGVPTVSDMGTGVYLSSARYVRVHEGAIE